MRAMLDDGPVTNLELRTVGRNLLLLSSSCGSCTLTQGSLISDRGFVMLPRSSLILEECRGLLANEESAEGVIARFDDESDRARSCDPSTDTTEPALVALLSSDLDHLRS